MSLAAGSLCVFMPLRYAASILSMLQLIVSTVLGIALWTEVSKWSVDVGSRITGTSAAAATYYTILAFSALIGTFAIFTRSKVTLKYFAFCLGWSLGLQLAISALQLWGYLASPRAELLQACTEVMGMDQLSCSRAFSLSVGWLITSIILGLLVQLCSAYVVSSYSSKLSEEDEFTEKAPLPSNISAPQMAQPAPAPDMMISRKSTDSSGGHTLVAASTYEDYGKNKGWAASSRTSTDSERSDDSDWSENERPPVPMLDPAPAPRHKRTRTPRVRPQYPEGTGPQSRDSELLGNMTPPEMPPRPAPAGGNTNPFSDPPLRAPPPAVLAHAGLDKHNIDISNAGANAGPNLNTLPDAARMV